MNPIETQGRKEIKEAVVIAALCTLANGLITWGLEKAKEQTAERKKKRDEGAKAKENDILKSIPTKEDLPMNEQNLTATSIPMHPVVSSNLAYVGYDAPSKCLFVTFKSGQTWRYDTVPPETFDGLMKAASIGSYFHHNVKGKFPETKVKG